jgi:hypothetical protein
MPNLEQDREILRELAEKLAGAAALPVNEERRRLWRALNGLKPVRPMVTISQVCWNEINADDKLTLRCTDSECKRYEDHIRKTLYQWEYFPADMVIDPYIRVGKAINNFGKYFNFDTFAGIKTEEETLATAADNDVVSHHFENQFKSIDDVEKIKMPVISHDSGETKRRMDKAHWLFDGIIPVKEDGFTNAYISIWDRIAYWMSVEGILYALIDESEMMHELTKKIARAFMTVYDQLEELNLLSNDQSEVHCTGAFTNDLPAPGFNPAKVRTIDMWSFGMAQVFATVSPAMFEEYELDYVIPIYSCFGLVYYGCCEPLHGRMKQVKKIPHLRKISISPWADKEKCAMEIQGDYVFSNKPNPAFVASSSFDADIVKKDLLETKKICGEYGCPFELILKDISTVQNKPERLILWHDIAMDIVMS